MSFKKLLGASLWKGLLLSMLLLLLLLGLTFLFSLFQFDVQAVKD